MIEILTGIDYNVVVQSGIIQHESMNRLNSSSVNTIRFLSHLTCDGRVIIRSSVVRMGRNGAHVDNASSGGITVGINNDGRLKNVAYDVNGNRYFTHPDSQTKFSDITIPNYIDIIQDINLLQWQLPQFRLLSWDIAIDESGHPIIIEVNMYSGQLDFHQLNNGPVFGEDTEAVLNEVFKR